MIFTLSSSKYKFSSTISLSSWKQVRFRPKHVKVKLRISLGTKCIFFFTTDITSKGSHFDISGFLIVGPKLGIGITRSAEQASEGST